MKIILPPKKLTKINSDYLQAIIKYTEVNFKDATSFVNEDVICERIITPILILIAKEQQLKLHSHVPLNIENSKDLTGKPDYA